MNREERNAYMREWNKNHYYKNLEKSRERARVQYHKHKEQLKDILNKRSRDYRKKNPDKIKSYNSFYSKNQKSKDANKRWREENKEHRKQYQKDYYKNNPHKRAEYERKRRAKKAGCWGNVPVGMWKKILEFYGNMCLCCGTREDLTQDHVVPLNDGGRHSPENLQPLCGHCNFSKGTKIIDYRKGRIFQP